jgi:hypothetical protein
MNWLINKLAKEETYFPTFLAALCLYSFLGCVTVNLMVSYYPAATKVTMFLLMLGAIALAYGSRLAHNLAYAKVNTKDKE